MSVANAASKAQALNDIELALLTSLIAKEHCIVQAESRNIGLVVTELETVRVKAAQSVFDFSWQHFACNEKISPDELVEGILIDCELDEAFSRLPDGQKFGDENPGPSQPSVPTADTPQYACLNDNTGQKLPNVLILTGLAEACNDVQVQILELMRARHILTHTSFYTAPKSFVIVVVLAVPSAPLSRHLNDHMFISHYHEVDNEDAFRDDKSSIDKQASSMASEEEDRRMITTQDIEALHTAADAVTSRAEVTTYLHNIVVFLRMHRAVGGGVSPKATQHFKLLVQCLAPLHNITYTTPSLVGLAARKIYPHRIRLAEPRFERSMQWGSSLEAVTELLKGYTPEKVVEEVLEQVDIPV